MREELRARMRESFAGWGRVTQETLGQNLPPTNAAATLSPNRLELEKTSQLFLSSLEPPTVATRAPLRVSNRAGVNGQGAYAGRNVQKSSPLQIVCWSVTSARVS